MIKEAIFCKKLETVELMLAAGFDPIHKVDLSVGKAAARYRSSLLDYESPPIIKAACWGTAEMVKLLIKHGCNVYVTGQILHDNQYAYESNALGGACVNGNYDVVSYLLSEWFESN